MLKTLREIEVSESLVIFQVLKAVVLPNTLYTLSPFYSEKLYRKGFYHDINKLFAK